MLWGRFQINNFRELLSRLDALEKRIEAVDARFTKITADVLDATERLDRVTKRSFRLKEQLIKLEENSDAPTAQEAPSVRHLTRDEVLLRATNRR